MNLESTEKLIQYRHNVPDNPLVSVCVQTYQHAKYIEQCLDGILMQKTSFPFEVLLGEDESTDGTREICIEYAKKHPDKIRL
ncbi:MAG: glycosyltransferase family 2 protein, partial [bacterium]